MSSFLFHCFLVITVVIDLFKLSYYSYMQGYPQKIWFLWLLNLFEYPNLKFTMTKRNYESPNVCLWTLNETEIRYFIKMNTSLSPIYQRKREGQRRPVGWEEWHRHKPKDQAQIVFQRIPFPKQQLIEDHQLTRHCQII